MSKYPRRTVLNIAPFIKESTCVWETVVYLPIYLVVIVDALSFSRLCVCVLFNCSNVPMVSLCLHLSPKSEKVNRHFFAHSGPHSLITVLLILLALLCMSQARDE